LSSWYSRDKNCQNSIQIFKCHSGSSKVIVFPADRIWNCVHGCVCHAQKRQSVSPVKMFASGPQTDIETERTDIQLLIKTNLILTLTQSKNFKLDRNLPVELFSVSCHSVDCGITSFQNRFPFREMKNISS